MFEVTGDEIQRLDDVELRTLVARLAIAELSAKGLPVSGVTAGGDQNAADGGLDVRVELQGASYAGDFIPRVPLGIQVKKPDMGPAAIAGEMKPNGTLRAVLGELADSGGAYVIVSSQGSPRGRVPIEQREIWANRQETGAAPPQLRKCDELGLIPQSSGDIVGWKWRPSFRRHIKP